VKQGGQHTVRWDLSLALLLLCKKRGNIGGTWNNRGTGGRCGSMGKGVSKEDRWHFFFLGGNTAHPGGNLPFFDGIFAGTIGFYALEPPTARRASPTDLSGPPLIFLSKSVDLSS